MSCPNCGSKLASVEYDHQKILHCPNCSGSFFDENGINRITEKTARVLASTHTVIPNSFRDPHEMLNSHQGSAIFQSGQVQHDKYNPLSCPKHGLPLSPITNNSAIPQYVRLYECPSCHGVFAMPEDLLNFKTAQDAKLNYLKAWQIPVPSLRSIMVLAVFLFISVLSFTTYQTFTKPQLANVQADDIVNGFYSTVSNQLVFIYFKTSIPVTASIQLEDRSTGEVITKNLNVAPNTVHSLTTGDINVKHEVYYSIILRDANGIETKTAVKKLELK